MKEQNNRTTEHAYCSSSNHPNAPNLSEEKKKKKKKLSNMKNCEKFIRTDTKACFFQLKSQTGIYMYYIIK